MNDFDNKREERPEFGITYSVLNPVSWWDKKPPHTTQGKNGGDK